jgi:hypothetical protein
VFTSTIIGLFGVYSNKLHPRGVPPAGEAIVAVSALELDALLARAPLPSLSVALAASAARAAAG